MARLERKLMRREREEREERAGEGTSSDTVRGRGKEGEREGGKRV